MAKVNNLYTSVGCSQTPGSVDWGNNNLIIYGACNSIALLDPSFKNESSKILKTFIGHKKRVNCVKWIKDSCNISNCEKEFLSGSDDGTCIYWKIVNNNEHEKSVLSGHLSGITSVDGIYVKGILTIVTTSTDSTVKIWRKSDTEFETVQTISLKTGFSFAVRLFILPQTDKLLLIFSTDDANIRLYSETNTDDDLFTYSNKLVGHEDWVRGLDVIQMDENELLIASASQDTFIRLWKIKIRDSSKKIVELGQLLGDHEHLETEEILFEVEKKIFSITLESVLQSHDGWVYGVNLFMNKLNNKVSLLSSSIDKTLIIWTFSENESGVWGENIRVGDIGGNSLGFYGGRFSADGKSILGHGYQGSLHLWRYSEETKNWHPSVINGGHFGKVNDIAWEPNGEFLFSASTDQTTRCHSIWSKLSTWHEIARPQIHGYDIQCITCLSRYKFASGAEEKIVRTFQAPINFIENFAKISSATLDAEANEIMSLLQKGASVPSLGLSNRAVSSVENQNNLDPESHFIALNLEKPPFEENLMQNTLWPEIQKLYGHGNELYSISASSDGKILASACRAANAEHAQIILWNTKTWKQIQKLLANKLTITQLKFSSNNKYLLSVSRDRRWFLFKNQSDTELPDFKCIQESPTSGLIHSRIIWTCDWSHDSKLFITGSREGKIISWKLEEDEVKHHANMMVKNESIGALAFYPNFIKEGKYLIAVGLESGEIQLYFLSDSFEKLCSIQEYFSHHLNVTKLQFRPQRTSGVIELASCGEDHVVRINEIILENQ